MRYFLLALRKDIRSEFRGRETFIILLAFSLLFSVLSGIAIQNSYLEDGAVRKLFAPLLWIIFLTVSTFSVGRAFEYEFKMNGCERLLSLGMPPGALYLSKVTVVMSLSFVSHLATTVVLGLLLNQQVAHVWAYLLISLLAVVGYSALAVIVAAMTASSRLRNVFVPLLLVPLLFPLFFGALELTAELFSNSSMPHASRWFSFLVGIDLVYLVLGLNLYEYVIRD